jgi:hypothetical protein
MVLVYLSFTDVTVLDGAASAKPCGGAVGFLREADEPG